MASETVSIRLPKEILAHIDRLAEDMAIERMTIIRRLIKVGVEGLIRHEEFEESADWPREGRMRLEILLPDLADKKTERKTLERMVSEMPSPPDNGD